MKPIKHGYIIAIFQLLHAVDGMNSSRVGEYFQFDRGVGVHCHHAVRIVIFIVVKRLARSVVVHSIDTVQKIIRIHDLIHPCMYFFVQIVVKVQGVKLNGAFQCHETYRGGSQRFFVLQYALHRKKYLKKRMYSKMRK